MENVMQSRIVGIRDAKIHLSRLIRMVRKGSYILLDLCRGEKMLAKKMINFTAGLLFVGILCLNGGAFGALPSDDVNFASEKDAGYDQIPSEVVFIDPSVPEIEKIVAQLPKGAEVVRLSPGVDGVAQISAHLKGKGNLSAIHIISHGSPGYFVLNGKRIDKDFLRDHGDRISPWGRALAENGDILLYACNLAATDKGKVFVEYFSDLTGADVASSTDVTGGKAFDGNWKLEYSTGRIAAPALAIDPYTNVKLPTARSWNGDTNTNWEDPANWTPSGIPASDDLVTIPAGTPRLAGAGSCGTLTIDSTATLYIDSGATLAVANDSIVSGTLSISTGTFEAVGSFTASGGAVKFTGAGNLILRGASPNLGTFTKGTGTVTYDGGTQLVPANGDYYGIAFGGTGTKTAASLTATTLSAPSGAYSLALNGACSITNSCTFLNTGTLALGNYSTDILTFNGGVTATTPSAVTLDGKIRTLGNTISIGDADTGVVLAEVATLETTDGGNTGGANVTLGGTVDGAVSLTLDAGTGGIISVMGAIGGSTQIQTLTITNSNGTTFNSSVAAGTVALSDTTAGANITFTGALATQALITTTNKGYNVELHGNGTSITNLVEFLNTGTVGLGNASGDTLTFNGGIETTGNATNPSSTTLNGTIATSSDPVALGTTTVSGNATVKPDGGDLTFGAVTINSGATLKAGVAGTTGTISFNSTVDGPGNLEVMTTDPVTFSGSIGSNPSLGTMTLTNGSLATGGNNITASGLTVSGGIFNSASAAGIWDINGNLSITGGELIATSGDLKFSGTTWNTSGGTFTANGGTVILDGTGQSLSGGNTTFFNLTKNVTSAATLTFPSATGTTVENTLNLSGASGQLLSLRSITTGTQWEIDPQGTRTIAFLDVQDSNNVGTAINAVGTNSVSSGNNTNWTFVIAGTYYVNFATGNDSNNGSSANPWKTLHHAIAQLNGGSAGTYVLYVASGTYKVLADNAGEADTELIISQDDVTVVAEPGTVPIIDGTGAVTWVYGIKITGSHVTLKNLHITGFTGTDPGGIGIEIVAGSNNTIENCRVYGNYDGISVSQSANCTIQGCEIDNNNYDGISISESAGSVITRNTIHDNYEVNNSDGIIVQACSPEISRNRIYDNRFNISIQAYDSEETSPTVKNNLIYENTSGKVDFGILIGGNNTSTVNPKIYHNTIDKGTYEGIIVEQYDTSAISPEIKYNIITNFNQYGIQNSFGSPIIAYNDVWNNGNSPADNYHGCTPGTNDISETPLYSSGGYSLLGTSPCKDAISVAAEDPVNIDYPGYKRPQGGGWDMGAYEYVDPEPFSYTPHVGTGVASDYRIFTVPLKIGTGTGANLLSNMQELNPSLFPYNLSVWRAFGFNGVGYIEFNDPDYFPPFPVEPGVAFWIITNSTNQIRFQGKPAPMGIPYEMALKPGWSLIGLPWTSTNINLGNIKVTDGVNTYFITDTGNDLTQQFVWDYTDCSGSPPSCYSGYERRGLGDTLQCGTGYFFKVLAETSVKLIIPHTEAQTKNARGDTAPDQTNANEDDEAPPPPPGAAPSPDIKANGQDGPVTVPSGSMVSVTVSLDPGNWAGRNADWWVAAYIPFAPPYWYTYVSPAGWQEGISVCVQGPLSQLSVPFEVLNAALPDGNYTLYFAVDDNADGIPDATWLDSVEVRVE